MSLFAPSCKGAKAFINIARPIVFWKKTGDWFEIGEADFLPLDVDFPDVDLTLESIGAFGSIDAMWEKVAPKLDAFYSNLSAIPLRIRRRYNDFIEDIMMHHSVSLFDLLRGITLDDYDPPQYESALEIEINPEDEINLYKNKSEVSSLHAMSQVNHVKNLHRREPHECSGFITFVVHHQQYSPSYPIPELPLDCFLQLAMSTTKTNSP